MDLGFQENLNKDERGYGRKFFQGHGNVGFSAIFFFSSTKCGFSIKISYGSDEDFYDNF